jgi:hypothetical protein
MIIQNVDVYDFHRAFEQYGRADQFSREAREALHDYLEQLSDDIGKPIELDVIGICCDFAEYDSICNAAYEHDWRADEQDADETEPEWRDRCNDEALEWLQDRTTVLELPCGGVVIQQF